MKLILLLILLVRIPLYLLLGYEVNHTPQAYSLVNLQMEAPLFALLLFADQVVFIWANILDKKEPVPATVFALLHSNQICLFGIALPAIAAMFINMYDPLPIEVHKGIQAVVVVFFFISFVVTHKAFDILFKIAIKRNGDDPTLPNKVE